LYELGFVAAVQWLVKQIEKKQALNVYFRDDGRPKPLSNDVTVFLFQAVRELLANVAKHSKASNCTVSLKTKGEKLKVEVDDDGIGFDATLVGSMGTEGNHFGFFSIRERLEPLGGSIKVFSKPNKGTRVTLVAPLAK
jgi:signal transduction histidine kinase